MSRRVSGWKRWTQRSCLQLSWVGKYLLWIGYGGSRASMVFLFSGPTSRMWPCTAIVMWQVVKSAILQWGSSVPHLREAAKASVAMPVSVMLSPCPRISRVKEIDRFWPSTVYSWCGAQSQIWSKCMAWRERENLQCLSLWVFIVVVHTSHSSLAPEFS